MDTQKKTQRTQRTQRLEGKKTSDPGSEPLLLSSVLCVLCVFLFDRDALREIARLIHVGSARHGHAVGQKLKR